MSTTTTGLRCICGATLTRTPGKKPRVYCSDACRKRAKRQIAKIVGTRQPEAANGDRPAKADALGKKTAEFPASSDQRKRAGRATAEGEPQESPEAKRDRRGRERRARRYADRRTLWKITNDKTCKGCGRTVMDPESGVILARTAEGNAVALGLLKCGKVWLCPVCSAKIRHGRAEEITKAAVQWMRAGGTVYLVTFTVRHAAADRLSDLFDALQGTRADKERGVQRRAGAYQRLITGRAWVGSRAAEGDRRSDLAGLRDRIGYIGMIRATEVTRSEANGWHPHIHALVFAGGVTEGERADKRVTGTFAPDAVDLGAWQAHWQKVWIAFLASVDARFTPDDRHGVDFKRLETAADAEDFGAYIAKTQDGKSPAMEVARGDLKRGRAGSVTPFQMLGRIGDLMGGVPEDADELQGFGTLEQCLAWWAEYERATKGRRAVEWTRYLRMLLGIDGDDSAEGDLDLLFEQDGASEFAAGIGVEARAWHKVAARALDLAVTEAVEGGELAEAASLVVASGAKAGAVRVLTPGEISEAYEGVLAKLADRREAAAVRRQVEAAGRQ